MSDPTAARPGRPLARRGPERLGMANLDDVARLAGVSVATASRALSGRAPTRTAAHERVAAAAAELGYVPNGLARSMMGVGRRSVAFVSREMVGPTFAAMAAGAEEVATASGHLFLLCTTHSIVQRERETIYSLREQRAAAVLLVGSTPLGDEFEERIAEYADALEVVGAKLILCGRPPLAALPHVATLDYDHVGGMRAAVAHLVGLGHRRIGYIDFDQESSTPLQRYRGYREGLEAAGLDPDERIVLHAPNDIESVAACVADFPVTDERVTAFVCVTDIVAIGARNGLRRRGLDVPGDVSIVGFDDMLLADNLTPPLTTVRAPFHDLGALAGRIAVGQTDFEGPVRLPTELIVRGSTAPPSPR